MTINGVLRAPTMIERIGFALFFTGLPGSLYYLNSTLSFEKLRSALIKKLKLEERL